MNEEHEAHLLLSNGSLRSICAFMHHIEEHFTLAVPTDSIRSQIEFS